MADRFEQWSRARLGEYVTVDGETHATIIVPVDGEHHDPRRDVIARLVPHGAMVVTKVDAEGGVIEVGGNFDPPPPTARHRKTRGK